MKKVLIIGLILIGIQSFGQGLVLPNNSNRWVTQPNPNQLRYMENQRNANIVIFMVNERVITNFNHWRIWHKLKERKRERIVRRWQKRHEKNNIRPEFLRRKPR